MLAGVNVTVDSMDPSQFSILGMSDEGSHNEFMGIGALIQIKRQLIDMIINDSTVWARSVISFKRGDMRVPMTWPSKIEYDVAFPNTVIRNAVIKGTLVP